MSRAGFEKEAFIYGLKDPRIDDPVLSIRYIGQTAVGPSRPKVHFSTETVLRSDGNKHKANWIRQLQREGLEPEVVVLERLDVATAVVPNGEGTTPLDMEERRLIAFYRASGAELTNIQDGGTSGYVLTEEEKQKISESRSWQGKSTNTVDPSIVLGPWSCEKAWWLGLTFARGSVRNDPGRRSVSFKSTSLDLVEKWLVVCGARSKHIRRDPESVCWAADQGDVRTAKWLIEQYALHEKWTAGLCWPSDLPDEFVIDFVRGLWDTKGYMAFKPRFGRQPSILTSVESVSWQADFVETLVARVGGCVVFKGVKSSDGNHTRGVAARGASTSHFLERIYGGAPDALCSVGQRTRALSVCDQWKQAQKECEQCGDVIYTSGSLCAVCSRRKYVGQDCACGRSPIVALGLCSACYQAGRTKNQKNWSLDKAVMSRLKEYDIGGWQKASPEEQEKQLDTLVSIYRSHGFPWFVLEVPTPEGVLEAVARGKLTVEGDVVRAVSGVGQTLCSKAHPHRLRASYRGNPSVVSAFEDDRFLRRAIRFQLKQGDPVTPKRVLRALSALYKGPTNFAPVLARWIVDTYAPEGGTVLDPCAGFGGRMLGAMASSKKVRYTGFDIEAKTVSGNTRLAEWLGAADRCSVAQADATKVNWPKADLVFTGPPYFEREQYGSSADEAIQRYATASEWVEGFLGTLVAKTLAAAPVAVFNIGSIHSGGVRYPLPDMLVEQVTRRGGKIDKSWCWELPTFGKSARDERLVVVRR